MSKYKRIVQRQYQIDMQKFEHEFDIRAMRAIQGVIRIEDGIMKIEAYPENPAFDKFRSKIDKLEKIKAKKLHIIITNIKRYIEASKNPRKIKLYLDVLNLLEKDEYYKARQLIVYQ